MFRKKTGTTWIQGSQFQNDGHKMTVWLLFCRYTKTQIHYWSDCITQKSNWITLLLPCTSVSFVMGHIQLWFKAGKPGNGAVCIHRKSPFHQSPTTIRHSDYTVTGQWRCSHHGNCQQHGDDTVLPAVVNSDYTITVELLCL